MVTDDNITGEYLFGNYESEKSIWAIDTGGWQNLYQYY